MIKSEVPYKPNTIVYFAHEQGLKKGVVQSVTLQVTAQGEIASWQILELLQADGEPERVIHHVPLANIASTWEVAQEKAEARIFSYRQAREPNPLVDANDMFES
jgi:hypothetical protein